MKYIITQCFKHILNELYFVENPCCFGRNLFSTLPFPLITHYIDGKLTFLAEKKNIKLHSYNNFSNKTS